MNIRLKLVHALRNLPQHIGAGGSDLTYETFFIETESPR